MPEARSDTASDARSGAGSARGAEPKNTVRISAPAAELDALFCCGPGPDDLAGWITGLPLANTAETANQVRQVCYELARLKAAPDNRLALLEQVRPVVNYLCTRMDRSAGTSSTHGDAMARLAQRLQANLCAGYKAVVRDSLGDGKPSDTSAGTLALAAHRALSDLSRTLLRTLQFYVAPAEQIWLEMNQLYLLAERAAFAGVAQEDPENHHVVALSPTAVYLRSVLLATCRPNQLRPRQLNEVFTGLELWVGHASIQASSEGAVFAVDLDSDRGPGHVSLLPAPAEPRGIQTRGLVAQLELHLNDAATDLTVPDTLSPTLLAHLADAWGRLKPRSQRRAATAVPMKICVGLRAVHYFLSGEVPFESTFMGSTAAAHQEQNPFLRAQAEREQTRQQNAQPTAKDPWDDAFDLRVRMPEIPHIQDPERILQRGLAGDAKDAAAANAAVSEGNEAARFYDATAVDTSPGGYRVRWNDPLPARLQTGEIVALREAGEPRWCVGVIRWIRQDRDGTAMGIELLSPRATPVAIRGVQKRGGPTSYSRGLMLPELAPINQPATLITPLTPFHADQKVHIYQPGTTGAATRDAQRTAQLLERSRKTESFNQFTFRMLAGYLENTHATLKMNDQ